MARLILYPLLAILLITLLRFVIGFVARAFSDYFIAPSSPGPRKSGAAAAGELKKDPVCGTYVAAATSVKLTVDGSVVHFCSESCRDKYKAR